MLDTEMVEHMVSRCAANGAFRDELFDRSAL